MHGAGSEDVQWFHVLCFYRSVNEICFADGKVHHSYLFQGFNTNFWQGYFDHANQKWVPGSMQRVFEDMHILLML
jgi:hypothetical protein